MGHRVVVRRRLADQGVGPHLSDLLGELTELTETHLTVRTRAGAVRVAVVEVVRAKRVPDTRRRSATERLELAAAAGWPAGCTERLGDWLLRATDGWTARGNSALPIGDPGAPLTEAIDAVTAWYRARGLTPAVSTPMPVCGRVAQGLSARGWRASRPTLVQTAELPDLVRTASPATAAVRVRLAETVSETWLTVVSRRKGALPEAARGVLTGVDQVRFAEVYADGGLVAIGRGVVADPAGEWLGLSLVEVEPAYRRRGLAAAVAGALASWAGRLGASRAYLQVEADNAAAVGLYDRLGFTTHHTYSTWRADQGPVPAGSSESANPGGGPATPPVVVLPSAARPAHVRPGRQSLPAL